MYKGAILVAVLVVFVGISFAQKSIDTGVRPKKVNPGGGGVVGPGAPCGLPCPPNYDPVCGMFVSPTAKLIRTFSNMCELENAQCQSPEWTLLYTGVCTPHT